MPRILALLAALMSFTAATLAEPQPAIVLWKDGAPGALGTTTNDIPNITPFLADPAKATGAAVVICPGGGYWGLADHEGKAYALYLNELGIHGFVLQYRLAQHNYHQPRMLEDAARALRTVRARAEEWKIDPKRIGIMGSSAGGHLASSLLTHFDAGTPDSKDPIDRVSSRPDMGILCYPVITMGAYTHGGSKKNLLGENPSADLVAYYSSELRVTHDTPPTFLFHTVADKAVPVENSLMFADALQKNGVLFDLHIYRNGQHGIGLANGHAWTKDLAFWFKENGFSK